MASKKLGSPQARLFWVVLSGVVIASRLAHRNILWADEDYHIAEAVQVLLGKVLYLDVWYDKPPLSALFLAIFGAPTGVALRFLGGMLAIANCAVAFQFARRIWGPLEGYCAAGLLAFFQVFYIASATIPLEPDTLMLLPHLLAIYWAFRGKPVASGLAAGVAFLLNIKGAFVLASALVFSSWEIASLIVLIAGFLVPLAAASIWLIVTGAFPYYIEQVWRWGMLYAGAPPNDAATTPLNRLTNWLGFHVALVLGIVGAWMRLPPDQPHLRLAAKWLTWTLLSLAAASLGWRLSPHYLNQLLPPLTIGAAGGFGWLWRRIKIDPDNATKGQNLGVRVYLALATVALLFPIARFGPRYISLAAEDIAGVRHTWSDVQMDQDSRRAAAILHRIAKPTDTVFIWGYRPNLIAYTGLPVASRFWDSQPITGVAADRHLGDATPLDAAWAAKNRQELIKSQPTFIIDGLSAYNQKLDIHNFPDLTDWLSRYCEISKTGEGITIYKRCR